MFTSIHCYDHRVAVSHVFVYSSKTFHDSLHVGVIRYNANILPPGRLSYNLRSGVLVFSVIVFFFFGFFVSRERHKGLIGRGHDLRLAILRLCYPGFNLVPRSLVD